VASDAKKSSLLQAFLVPPIGLEPMRFGLKDAVLQHFCSLYKALSVPE
jgi:hypothetical protein